MRILHTGHSYSPSVDGVAEIVRNISEVLASRGHDVHVATAALDGEKEHTELRGVHVHRFSVKGCLALGMSGNVKGYREFVSSGNWDLLVNHCLSAWPADALLDEIAHYPWPSILVTQGLGTSNPRFENYFRELPRYLPSYYKWIRVSHSTEEIPFAEKFRLPVPPVITNGVDIARWAQPSLGVRQLWRVGNAPWIVNVSNHYGVRHKNHPMLFELARRLASTLPGTIARVTLIGNPHPMFKWNLGAVGLRGGCYYGCRARAMMSRSVELKTYVPREYVISAIQEADVLVSSSTWEANSVVLLESMAAGTPWVSTDVGSARELAGGVVVRCLSEMVEEVGGLLADSGRRRSLGTAGRARAVQRHDWETVVDQYEDLYQSAIRSRQARRSQLSLNRIPPGLPNNGVHVSPESVTPGPTLQDRRS
jgi:glycosyltransferase involved in cell wall biosynthesis